MPRYITSVDPKGAVAQLDNGEQIVVTNMFDADGREVFDPAFCRRGVAGPCTEGGWYTFACGAEEDAS